MILSIIKYFYELSVSTHIEHVNVAKTTQSYAQHEALGSFLDVVNSTKDRLIEYCIGKGYVNTINLGSVTLDTPPMDLANTLADAFCNVAEQMDDEALCNMAGEFEEAVGKLKYFYNFK